MLTTAFLYFLLSLIFDSLPLSDPSVKRRQQRRRTISDFRQSPNATKMRPFAVSVLLPPLLFCLSFCLGSVLNDDVLGLIVFKVDLLDPAGKLSSWNVDDQTPCGWTGVNCDKNINRVTDLVLDGFSLSGKIGRGLLRLQSLRRLSLTNNNISGSLPANIVNLGSLSSVDFSSNLLTGVIPDGFLDNCGNLMELSLANNGLSGGIPESLGSGSCSSLAVLNLSGNKLTGPIPTGLWGLNGLQELDLSKNALSGRIPVGLGKLSNLKSLSLKRNVLSGPIPDDIGQSLLLNRIDLSGNSLSGGIPESVQNLSMCVFFSLGNNSLTGELPAWMGELSSLQTLDLSGNGFNGSVPDSLGKLQLLQSIDFSRNMFTGSLPESMSTCTSLRNVSFSQNTFTGGLPNWTFVLGLQQFVVSGNNLDGNLEIPTPSKSNLTLKLLQLSGNAFSGAIPLEIKNLQDLRLLDLSQNSLSGPIPVGIGEMKALEVLDLSVNQLNGSIPSDIGGAASLKQLVLGENYLSGSIPTQLEGCSSLASLILSWNNLSGSLQPNIANLTKLQTVDLSHNNFSGSLPKQLSNLAQLVSFNVSSNHFSGDLPAGKYFHSIPMSSLSDNPSLCGSVVNVSCHAVLPKPIVLNPNSSSSVSSTVNSTIASNFHQKKIILSISAVIAIAAAALIALGVIAVTVLNFQVRTSANASSRSAAALAFSDDYYSRSPGTDANSGKLVLFSGDDPDFSTGTHAVLNKDCELGRGGFGAVYRTVLQDGRPVAIKKLTVSSLVKTREDFVREVKNLARPRHHNLVTLEGYYWTPSLQLLIYEFVSGGSLHKLLHESAGRILSWQERFDVIIGIAMSLAHLHHMNIIHYNLKSSNVLIDQSGVAKLGDYGLAKLLPMLDRYVLSSKNQSALGYMAPEFACSAVKITEKCDVYGFGVLVLEILTGKRPVEYLEDDVVVLCDMVRGALEEGRVEECVDGRIGGNFPADEAVPVMKLGLICTSQVPSNRPDMAEVVNILELIRSPQD